MGARLSDRLAAIVKALPLDERSRVLEIGCGPGAAARAVAERVPLGFVLAIDRSAKAIELASATCASLIADGRMSVRHVAIEDLVLDPSEPRFDVVVAIRVGALDGRHPAAGERALARIAQVLAPAGQLLVDGGDPLRQIPLRT